MPLPNCWRMVAQERDLYGLMNPARDFIVSARGISATIPTWQLAWIPGLQFNCIETVYMCWAHFQAIFWSCFFLELSNSTSVNFWTNFGSKINAIKLPPCSQVGIPFDYPTCARCAGDCDTNRTTVECKPGPPCRSNMATGLWDNGVRCAKYVKGNFEVWIAGILMISSET